MKISKKVYKPEKVKSLMQKHNLISLIASGTLTLSGCSTVQKIRDRYLAPIYSTNAQYGEATSFRSKDFRSGIPTFDFGRSERRIVGKINPADVVTDIEGNVLDNNRVLGLWTLIEGEYGYDINRTERNLELRTPDSAVRIYVEQEGVKGILTNKSYVEQSIPQDKRVFVKGHPDFWLPSYRVNINGVPTNLFYSTIVDNGQKKLALIPNADRFRLYKNQITINGRVYNEILGKVQSMGDSLAKETIVTGELILTNPVTGENKEEIKIPEYTDTEEQIRKQTEEKLRKLKKQIEDKDKLGKEPKEENNL